MRLCPAKWIPRNEIDMNHAPVPFVFLLSFLALPPICLIIKLFNTCAFIERYRSLFPSLVISSPFLPSYVPTAAKLISRELSRNIFPGLIP